MRCSQVCQPAGHAGEQPAVFTEEDVVSEPLQDGKSLRENDVVLSAAGRFVVVLLTVPVHSTFTTIKRTNTSRKPTPRYVFFHCVTDEPADCIAFTQRFAVQRHALNTKQYFKARLQPDAAKQIETWRFVDVPQRTSEDATPAVSVTM